MCKVDLALKFFLTARNSFYFLLKCSVVFLQTISNNGDLCGHYPLKLVILESRILPCDFENGDRLVPLFTFSCLVLTFTFVFTADLVFVPLEICLEDILFLFR